MGPLYLGIEMNSALKTVSGDSDVIFFSDGDVEGVRVKREGEE